MKLFNGIITIASTPEEVAGGATSQWSFEAQFQSNDGFLANDIQAKDVVIFKGYDINSDTSQLCRYVVESVAPSDKAGYVVMTVSYGEDTVESETIFAPYEDDDTKVGLIGRKTSENGFTFLPTAADGIDEATLEKARNIDLKSRDEEFTVYVNKKIEEVKNSSGGSTGTGEGGSATDDTKLPIAGGTITGDLTVENQTTLNKTKIQAGDTSVDVTANGITTTISSVAPVDTKTVASDNKIDASVSRVSANEAANVTDLAKGATAERLVATRADGNAISTEEVSSTDESATKVVNVNGKTTAVQINSLGTEASSIKLSTNAENGTVEIKGKQALIEGETSVKGDVSSTGGVTANKFFMTSEETDFADNQLVSQNHMSEYVINYVAEKIAGATGGGITQAEVKAMLADYVDEEIFETRLAQALATIDPENILQNETHHFVTEGQMKSWNEKQDVIDTTVFEMNANKGKPQGYAPLDYEGKIALDYLPFSVLANSVPVKFIDEKVFEEDYNYKITLENGKEVRIGRLQGSLFFVMSNAENIVTETADFDITNWRFVAVYKASQADVDAGRAEIVGQQFKHEFGCYNPTKKLIKWSSIDEVPENLVYTTEGKISEEVLPVVEQKEVGGILFDEHSRPVSYSTPEDIVTKNANGKIAATVLPEVYDKAQTFGGLTVDKYGRVTKYDESASGGSSSGGNSSTGGSASQWYRVKTAEGHDQFAYRGTGSGIKMTITNNQIDINVPEGVDYDLMQIWMPADKVATDQGIRINLDKGNHYEFFGGNEDTGIMSLPQPMPDVAVYTAVGGISRQANYSAYYDGELHYIKLTGAAITPDTDFFIIIRR